LARSNSAITPATLVRPRDQPKQTGLSPFSDGYDYKAWSYIRNGNEIGRCGKVILTWTAPKPPAPRKRIKPISRLIAEFR
jgi:hypothetical protein